MGLKKLTSVRAESWTFRKYYQDSKNPTNEPGNSNSEMAALCRVPTDGARVRGDIQKSIQESSLDLNTSRLLSTSLLGWLKPHQDPDS